MLFGKRRRSVATQQPNPSQNLAQPEMFVVSYEKMQKGNKLSRRGRPIRQVAVVVSGTAKLVTSGDAVDRKTYEALIQSGVLTEDGVGETPKFLTAEERASAEPESD